ncbi:MAG TPA: aminotransferase class I/II-fold pyridoxal phosphate-dependent enzyme [Myxococcota bacterium]
MLLKTISTLCARAGAVDDEAGPVIGPIAPSTTFARDRESYALTNGKMYLRDDHENAAVAERLLAQLEGACGARLFASGLSAAAAVFTSLLRPGDAVVASAVCYFGVRHWLTQFGARFSVEVSFVDASDAELLASAIANKKPKLVWIETPGNPTLDVVDIAAAAGAAHAHGALLCVDSTVATPVHTKPLELGADLVVHSATKYLNGHSDVLAGAVCARVHDESWRAICAHRHDQGALPGPFEAWLLVRGMRTLALRVRQQSASALTIATLLAQRGDVRVLYPGVPSHKNHDVAARQMHGGFGGLMSICVGSAERALAVVRALTLFVPATSLGGVESLVEHRASVEPKGTETPADLLRLSIGIEDVDELCADLSSALNS